MKNFLMVLLLATSSAGGLLLPSLALAGQTQKKDLSQDIDSLGDDQVLIQRAKAMDPKNKVQIVQKRAVDLNWRVEIGGDYAYVGGGDTYIQSQNIGGYLDLHITPRWAVGFRYNNFINQLTSEGQSVFSAAAQQQAANGTGVQVPGVDNPQNTELFVVSWAPIYGKLNLFDSYVAHFDVYVLAGGGKTQTQNGENSDTVAAGVGMAWWLSQHITSHFEFRYQAYNDLPVPSVTRQENLFIGQFALGLLL